LVKSSAGLLKEKDLISSVENCQLALKGAIGVDSIGIVEYASFLVQESTMKQLKVVIEVEVQEESKILGG
jgi:hypothetical protein